MEQETGEIGGRCDEAADSAMADIVSAALHVSPTGLSRANF
jgi:hypothetical protein